MSRRINKIEDILLPILGLINGTNGLGLDGNAPLSFQFHVIQYLGLHLPAGKKACLLYDSVCQRRFSMIDMRDNTKITNSALIYSCHLYPSP